MLESKVIDKTAHVLDTYLRLVPFINMQFLTLGIVQDILDEPDLYRNDEMAGRVICVLNIELVAKSITII
jgi:hypothetical protein